MKELTPAQQEYIRALKCVHYFLSGESLRQRTQKNRKLSDVLNLCDSRLLLERINISNGFFGVSGAIEISIPDNSQASFDAGITHALDTVLSDPYFETDEGIKDKAYITRTMTRHAERLRELADSEED